MTRSGGHRRSSLYRRDNRSRSPERGDETAGKYLCRDERPSLASRITYRGHGTTEFTAFQTSSANSPRHERYTRRDEQYTRQSRGQVESDISTLRSSEDLQEELDQVKAELACQADVIRGKDRGFERFRKDTYARLGKQIDELQSDRRLLREEVRILQERVDLPTGSRSKLEQEMDRLREDNHDLHQKNGALEEQERKLKIVHERFKSSNDTLTCDIDEFKADKTRLAEQLCALRAELADSKTQCSGLITANQELAKRIAQIGIDTYNYYVSFATATVSPSLEMNVVNAPVEGQTEQPSQARSDGMQLSEPLPNAARKVSIDEPTQKPKEVEDKIGAVNKEEDVND